MLDDNKADAEVVKLLLAKSRPEPDFNLISDKKSFSLALDEKWPDLIISDSAGQRFSATEALDMVIQKAYHIPFIVVTRNGSDEFAANIIKQGADDYVLKDRLGRLPSAIDAALRKRKAEKDLRDYKYAIDQTSIISITDQKGTILYSNKEFCARSGYSVEELVGKDHRVINSGYHSKEYMKNLWTTISSGGIWRGEFCNKAKDGTFYWVDANIVPFLDEAGKPYQYFSIRTDITERKRAEALLKKMEEKLVHQRILEKNKIGRTILSTQEKERNHLGQELHDNINQILVSTKLYLTRGTKTDQKLCDQVKYPIELIETAINEIRVLTHRHVTPSLKIDLEKMLKALLKDQLMSSSVKTSLKFKLARNIVDDDLKLNIYRIVQELLTNINKHAGAKSAVVQVSTSDDNMLQVIVSDNGKGFKINKKRSGIGISNIEHRVSSFDGTMEIESASGSGCTVKLKIPY